MPTDAKRQAVAELTELLRSSSALAVADYRGLKVSEMQSVRRSLRASGVRAARRQESPAEDRRRRGGSRRADARCSPVPPPWPRARATRRHWRRRLQDALRPYSKVVALRGGLLGGVAVDAAVFQQLASLPSRDVLLGRLAGAMASPIAGMAGVLAGNLRNLVGVLSAVADQKRASEGGSAA